MKPSIEFKMELVAPGRAWLRYPAQWLCTCQVLIKDDGNKRYRWWGCLKKILKHLGFWDQKTRPPPKATGPSKIQEYQIDFSTSQLPVSDKWLYVDPEYPEVYPPLWRVISPDFESLRWVDGIVLPKFNQFPYLLVKIKRLGHRLGIRALPQFALNSASELPPQHHVVKFSLTHKEKYAYTLSPKSDFLSYMIISYSLNRFFLTLRIFHDVY